MAETDNNDLDRQRHILTSTAFSALQIKTFGYPVVDDIEYHYFDAVSF